MTDYEGIIKDVIDTAIPMGDSVKAKDKDKRGQSFPPDYLSWGDRGNPDGQENRLHTPPVMDEKGFHGPLREVVDIATENSEASPVAIAANYLAMFAACVGRGPYQEIGDGICHARPFMLLVGKSAKARKGTSEDTPRKILECSDSQLAKENQGHRRLKVHTGGLSSGEGIGYALRDPVEDKKGVVTDEGVTDKRLLIIEPEFANAMAAASREKSTLSGTIRNLWDGRTIEPLVKNSRWKATRPHGVIMGHITVHELLKKTSDVDAYSGFLNRFVMLYVARAKLVSDPLPTTNEKIIHLARCFGSIVQTATENFNAENQRKIVFSAAGKGFWNEIYPELTRDIDGITGALMARAEIYCRMYAMEFALLDKAQQIEICHIEAAMAWNKYWRESVEYIYGDESALQELEAIDKLADEVLAFVKEHQGCSRTDLTTWFRHDYKAERVDMGLERLFGAAPARLKQTVEPRADGKNGKGKTRFWTN